MPLRPPGDHLDHSQGISVLESPKTPRRVYPHESELHPVPGVIPGSCKCGCQPSRRPGLRTFLLSGSDGVRGAPTITGGPYS